MKSRAIFLVNFILARLFYPFEPSFRKFSIFRLWRRLCCPRKIFVLLHVPRSGGTFFKTQIERYVKKCVEVNDFSFVDFGSLALAERPVFYLSHCQFTEANLGIARDIQWICLLRDPRQRLVSQYAYSFNFKRNKKAENIFCEADNLVASRDLSLYEYLLEMRRLKHDNDLVRQLSGIHSGTGFSLQAADLSVHGLADIPDVEVKHLELAMARLSTMHIVFTDQVASYLGQQFSIPERSKGRRNLSLKDNFLVDEDSKRLMDEISYYDNLLFDYVLKLKSEGAGNVW